MDYSALAKQFGGSTTPKTVTTGKVVDYSALAKQFGGSTNVALAPEPVQDPNNIVRPQLKKFTDIPDIETKAQKISRYNTEADIAQKESKNSNSFGGILGNTLKGIGSTIASSEIGTAKTFALGKENLDTYTKNIDSLTNTSLTLKKQIANGIKAGENVDSLKRSYNDTIDQLHQNYDAIDEYRGNVPTYAKAIGQLGGTALDLLTAGTYGEATTAMRSGQLAKKTVPTLASLVAKTGENVANAGTKTARQIAIDSAKTVGKALPVGYGYDVSQNLQNGETGASVAKPGLGTVLSAIPGLAEGTKAAVMARKESVIANKGAKLDSVVGKILPSVTDTKRPAATATIAAVDKTGVKTYSDLAKNIKADQARLSNETDVALSKDTEKLKMNNLNDTNGTNHVKTALNDLTEHATAARKPELQAKVDAWIEKANGEGLTRKDINDIARESSQNLSQKSFTKSGLQKDAEKGQAIENTRKGLKAIARAGEGGDIAAANDKLFSQHSDTLDLVKKQQDASTKAIQKIKSKGLFGKLGGYVGHAVDMASGHFISGAIKKFIPNAGIETMSAIDIQKALKKNLKIFDKISKTNVPERITALSKKLDKKVLLLPEQTGAAPAKEVSINLGERSQSTIDAQERVNPKIKTPTTTKGALNRRYAQTQVVLDANRAAEQAKNGLPIIDVGKTPIRKSNVPTVSQETPPKVYTPEIHRYVSQKTTLESNTKFPKIQSFKTDTPLKISVTRQANKGFENTDISRGGTWYTTPESKSYDFSKDGKDSVNGMIGGDKKINTMLDIKKPLVVKDASMEDGSFAVINSGYENYMPKKYTQIASDLYDKVMMEDITKAKLSKYINDALQTAGIPENKILSTLNSKNFTDNAFDLIVSKGLKESGYDAIILENEYKGKVIDRHIFKFGGDNIPKELLPKEATTNANLGKKMEYTGDAQKLGVNPKDVVSVKRFGSSIEGKANPNDYDHFIVVKDGSMKFKTKNGLPMPIIKDIGKKQYFIMPESGGEDLLNAMLYTGRKDGRGYAGKTQNVTKDFKGTKPPINRYSK